MRNSYKRIIKAAINAAGLDATHFEISRDSFESNRKSIKAGNRELRHVAAKLREVGQSVTLRGPRGYALTAYLNYTESDRLAAENIN